MNVRAVYVAVYAIVGAVKRKPVGRLVGVFKTVTTKRFNETQCSPGEKLWQRNYYERIIRNEQSYIKISEYIQNNPQNWKTDKFYKEE